MKVWKILYRHTANYSRHGKPYPGLLFLSYGSAPHTRWIRFLLRSLDHWLVCLDNKQLLHFYKTQLVVWSVVVREWLDSHDLAHKFLSFGRHTCSRLRAPDQGQCIQEADLRGGEAVLIQAMFCVHWFVHLQPDRLIHNHDQISWFLRYNCKCHRFFRLGCLELFHMSQAQWKYDCYSKNARCSYPSGYWMKSSRGIGDLAGIALVNVQKHEPGVSRLGGLK